ncbi:MAG TPA: FtsX-like permease family protein [Gammaproteobacteria bacterium]|nr:FtsX-like permease family protein [Gammaproteobacteria bacterium]
MISATEPPASTFTAARAVRLALRFLKREWLAGELRVLIAAVIVAVGAITAVGFFTDRMNRAMELGATELLAADLLVRSTTPVGSEIAAEAHRRGLQTAETVSFRSVVVAGDQFQLAELKAVSDTYPLRGRLRTATVPYGNDAETSQIPPPDTAWLDPRLFALLGVRVGDGIEIGARQFRIGAVLSFEPDRGGDLFNIAPRVLINLDNLAGTRLIRAGSRAQYRVLFAGAPERIDFFRGWLSQRLKVNQTIQGIRDARPELRRALERADQFLSLAALVSVLLAGVAIAIAARRFAGRHLDTAAMLRCLGVGQREVGILYTTEVFVIGAGASLAGCIAGYAAQLVLAGLFSTFIVSSLPAPSLLPVLQGYGIGLITLAGFALPPLLRLRDVPPSRVLRRELGPARAGTLGFYAASALAFGGLVFWQARDPILAAYVIGGGLATMAVLCLVAVLLVRVLSRFRRRVGVAWRFGLANITRRAGASTLQIVGFGIGIMVMLLLSLVRSDLLESWDQTVPPDAPNYFLVNVQPDEVNALDAFLADNGLASTALYPMVKGRLTAVNGKPVTPEDYEEQRARHLVAREFNLSWLSKPQPQNRVISGNWWTADDHGKPLLSVEQGIAERLGLKLGDTIRFNVAGRDIDAPIANLRHVEWDSFQVNFFVVTPPGVLEHFPATYISAFHLPRERNDVLLRLVQRFPSVTIIDTDALLKKIREIMEHATTGVEYVFAFTLIAGVVVMFSAIQSTLDERRYESAVVRVLGAGRSHVTRGLLAEFLTLGLLAGLVAAVAATATGAVLALQVFDIGYRINPWMWLFGAGGGAAGVGLAGWLGTRGVLDHPPVESLRGT